MSEVAAIVLAAGQGTRFGAEPKLLAALDGKPMVRHVVEAAANASVHPILVVTGHRADDVEGAISDLPISAVRNRLFTEGLSTSLKIGFAALPRESRGAVILLGDMPYITTGLINSLVGAWQEASKPMALVPTFRGRRGNPVLLSRALNNTIMNLSGDAGAGKILRSCSNVMDWPTKNKAILHDIDMSQEMPGRLG